MLTRYSLHLEEGESWYIPLENASVCLSVRPSQLKGFQNFEKYPEKSRPVFR
jgi:hypothetical protein